MIRRLLLLLIPLVASAEDPKKCLPAHDPLFEEQGQKPHLWIFTSFSLPLESWQEYSYHLEKLDGVFVLNGIPENSFALLAEKIANLRKRNVFASIIIDPSAFEKFNVDKAPTILVENAESFDKIAGHISLRAALKLFAEEGQTSSQASFLLAKMEASP